MKYKINGQGAFANKKALRNLGCTWDSAIKAWTTDSDCVASMVRKLAGVRVSEPKQDWLANLPMSVDLRTCQIPERTISRTECECGAPKKAQFSTCYHCSKENFED
jgi:hypothetical protein